MAEEITITVDDRAVRQFLEKAPRLMRKVEKAAVSKTTTFVKGVTARVVGGREGVLNVPLKEARKVIRIKVRPTTANPIGEVEVTGKAIRMSKFAARKTKKGVTVKIFRVSGERRLFEKSFIIRKGSFVGVFKRENKRGEGRQFRQMWGPAVSDVLDFSPATLKKITSSATDKLSKETLSQISRFLKIKASVVREAFE